MNKQIFFTILLTVATIFSGFAQRAQPTEWQTKVSKTTVKPGETVELIMTADIEDGWYVYSSDFDPDLGPVVATFSFTENDSYELVGDVKPIGAKSKEDKEIWMGTYTYFKKKAEFRQTVRILKENPVIKVKLNAQACSDETGQCVPVIRQFTFDNIKVEAAKESTGTPEPDTKTDASDEENQKDQTKAVDEKEVSEKESAKGKPSKPEKGTQAAAPSKTDSKVAEKTELKPDQFSSRLEYLKAHKQQLIKTTSSGEDQVREELKDFVSKYGE